LEGPLLAVFATLGLFLLPATKWVAVTVKVGAFFVFGGVQHLIGGAGFNGDT
jgi:hypothetical protein